MKKKICFTLFVFSYFNYLLRKWFCTIKRKSVGKTAECKQL